ncbi:MAG: cytochrome b6-f complex subunit PetL [Leptolyngbya sp. IPPAS B-1204]|uniref:Cytochrome b6-f complex subunit 6 n=1 Tax=Leptolyngbya sp. NK1-12 TaxID=2547451 RepID=A0AA96WFY3_9CYAN|nr:cytochrome b6-f complex subunit 6 [Elainella sp. C42_A2020_010]RNJ70210.1 MAG: cytochrome b6-f complex subunit 6 [Leptolyngbya sp. IPPAS B-1204]WNZ24668.1 cytochrome b6-f complex subunit 6 [Leptolyngbya sp. NK1-12]
MGGVITYFILLGTAFGLAMGLYFGLRTAKII